MNKEIQKQLKKGIEKIVKDVNKIKIKPEPSFPFYPFNEETVRARNTTKRVVKDNKALVQYPNRCARGTSTLTYYAAGSIVTKKTYYYCGYVAIPNEKLPIEWKNEDLYADDLHRLNIYGGLNYCDYQEEYTVFGFDCNHYGDDERKELQDEKFVFRLVDQMEYCILEYAKQYDKWKKSYNLGRLIIIKSINSHSTSKFHDKSF